jgi:malate dehydrogenase (oxaloacetate-decarboxylating)(NADP+)
MKPRKAKPQARDLCRGEEDVVLRAAIQFRDGYGTPVLVGRDATVLSKLQALGVANPDSFESTTAYRPLVPAMVDRLYTRLQRRGYLRRDVQRMVNRDRNIFGSLLLAMGGRCNDHRHDPHLCADHARSAPRDRSEKGRTPSASMCWSASRIPCSWPTPRSTNARVREELAYIAEGNRAVARRMGHDAARCLPVLFDLRQPGGQLAGISARRWRSSTSARWLRI